MDETVLAQSRALHHTIRLLQTRILTNKVHGGSSLAIAPKDFTIPQIGTMLVVRDGVKMSLKEIAGATGVSPSSASTMVDRLVDYGVLVREHCNVDRREVRISISEQGSELIDFVEQQLLQALSGLLEKLGPDLARQWCEVYSRIQEILDEEAHDGVCAKDVLTQGVE